MRLGVIAGAVVAAVGSFACSDGGSSESNRKPTQPQASEGAKVSVRVVAEGLSNTQGLTVDDEYIFWIDWSGEPETGAELRRVARAGGDARALLRGEGLRGLVRDDEYLYWIEGTSIRRMPLDGPLEPHTLVEAAGEAPAALAVDQSSLYWSDQTPDGRILRVAKDGGAATVLAKGQSNPDEVAVNGHSVYWTTLGRLARGDEEIARVSKRGGPGSAETIARADSAALLTVDDHHVYWASEEQGGALWVRHEGGSSGPEKVWSGTCAGIAVQGKTLFWIAGESSSLWRAPTDTLDPQKMQDLETAAAYLTAAEGILVWVTPTLTWETDGKLFAADL